MVLVDDDSGTLKAVEAALSARGIFVVPFSDPDEARLYIHKTPPDLVLTVPVFEGADFGGFMIGIFRVQELFDFILHQHVAAGYAIAVYDDEEEIYKQWGHPRRRRAMASGFENRPVWRFLDGSRLAHAGYPDRRTIPSP